MPLFLAHTLFRSLRDGGSRYLKERLGFCRAQQNNPVWIHAASVGEVITVLPLLQLLLESENPPDLLVTTNTPTGRETLLNSGISEITHCYLPIDYQFAISRFLKEQRPQCAIIVETEIWPKLFTSCANTDVAIVIVNARVSAKTTRVKTSFLAPTYAIALQCVNLVLARSEADAEQFRQLSQSDRDLPDRDTPDSGSPEQASGHTDAFLPVTVMGNLKHASRALETSEHPVAQRAYVVLASTHADEEIELATEWTRHQRAEILVIAPRHPDRSASILQALQPLGVGIAVRSNKDPVTATTQILLADTLGELQSFYEHAAVTFVGGSLAHRGGHNILEPARQGCAIVVGPNMENFHDEFDLLFNADAISQQPQATSIVNELCRLLDDDEDAQKMAHNAVEATRKLQSMGEKYLEVLLPWLDKQTQRQQG